MAGEPQMSGEILLRKWNLNVWKLRIQSFLTHSEDAHGERKMFIGFILISFPVKRPRYISTQNEIIVIRIMC